MDHPNGCNCTAHGNSAFMQSLDELDFQRGIWTCSLNGDLKKLNSLLNDRKTDPNLLDTSGYSALHYASRSGHSEIVALLISKGANVNARTRSGGSTPLMRACFVGNISVVELLLKSPSIDVNIQDSDGQTALHKASEVGNVECFKLLLEKGARKDIRDKQGRNAIDLAKNQFIFEQLIKIP